MGCQVIFSPQAIARLEEIVRYIAEDNPAAAHRLGMKLVDRAELLADFPELGRPFPKRAGGASSVSPALSRLLPLQAGGTGRADFGLLARSQT
jgi:plasmid stabilization system protein ParE